MLNFFTMANLVILDDICGSFLIVALIREEKECMKMIS